MEFPDQGSDLSHSCKLPRETRSLTHCARPGIESVSWRSLSSLKQAYSLPHGNVINKVHISLCHVANHGMLALYTSEKKSPSKRLMKAAMDTAKKTSAADHLFIPFMNQKENTRERMCE